MLTEALASSVRVLVDTLTVTVVGPKTGAGILAAFVIVTVTDPDDDEEATVSMFVAVLTVRVAVGPQGDPTPFGSFQRGCGWPADGEPEGVRRPGAREVPRRAERQALQIVDLRDPAIFPVHRCRTTLRVLAGTGTPSPRPGCTATAGGPGP